MEIQGQINDVTSKQTQKGVIYLIAFSDGNEYMTKRQQTATEARNAKGSTVTANVEVTQNGQYTNRYWNGFTTGDQNNATQTVSTVATTIPQQPVVSTPSDKDAQIARAVALKAAVDMANGGLLGEPTPALVVSTAKEFEPYLLGVEQPSGKAATPWDAS